MMGLPRGFTFDEFHTMLNLDGKDHLRETEFVDSLHRIYFSSDFQKTCLTQLGIGQIKEMTQHLRHREAAEFRRLRRQIHKVKVELLAELRKRPRRPRCRKKVEFSTCESSSSSEAYEGDSNDSPGGSEEDASSTSSASVVSASQLERRGRSLKGSAKGKVVQMEYQIEDSGIMGEASGKWSAEKSETPARRHRKHRPHRRQENSTQQNETLQVGGKLAISSSPTVSTPCKPSIPQRPPALPRPAGLEETTLSASLGSETSSLTSI